MLSSLSTFLTYVTSGTWLRFEWASWKRFAQFTLLRQYKTVCPVALLSKHHLDHSKRQMNDSCIHVSCLLRARPTLKQILNLAQGWQVRDNAFAHVRLNVRKLRPGKARNARASGRQSRSVSVVC